MRKHLLWVATITGSVLGATPRSEAQSCFSGPWIFDYDPATTTSVVSTSDLSYGGFVLQSPEHPDSAFVYHVGHPNGDGCVAGIEPGSADPVGILDLVRVQVSCIHFEIESEVLPEIELTRWDGTLRETFTPATSHVEIIDWPSEVYRIRIRPAVEGGVRVPFCIDDVGYVTPGLPTKRASWGSIKAFYR